MPGVNKVSRRFMLFDTSNETSGSSGSSSLPNRISLFDSGITQSKNNLSECDYHSGMTWKDTTQKNQRFLSSPSCSSSNGTLFVSYRTLKCQPSWPGCLRNEIKMTTIDKIILTERWRCELYSLFRSHSLVLLGGLSFS